jgi:uncharacterized protein YecE (DUF72 family)
MPLAGDPGSGSVQVPLRVTAPVVYVRFHGNSQPGGNYSLAVLETWAKRLETWQEPGLDAFVYFNNDVGG